MKQYLALLEDVLTNGEGREDRTGTGTIGVFGRPSSIERAMNVSSALSRNVSVTSDGA